MSAEPEIDAYLARFDRGQPRFEAPQAEVARAVRAYVGALREHLAARHRRGDDPQLVNAANSDGIDRLVRRLFRLAEAAHYTEGGAPGPPFTLVAVGGYARREMSIQSDVDLLFLYAEPLDEGARSVAQSVQYRLWDAGGISVGCAVRTIDETLELAERDPTVRTSVLDLRYLAGDTGIFHELADALRVRLFHDAATFVRERVEALSERHVKYGESLYLLQPNLKEGVGGLRDYHTAYWVARAVHRARGLDDLLHQGLLTEREMERLRAALRFVWRVRNELHLLSRRRNDQMSFELQERVAEALGYTGRDGRELAVEAFMGDYYRHARDVKSYADIVIEQCQKRVAPATGAIEAKPVEDGFRLVGDHLEVPHGAHLRERPVRLLLAFAVAQDHEVPLSRTALRLVGENLDVVDDALRRDREAARVFERILSSEHRVMRSLMAMNEVGLLGAYLPEWDHIVCRWQHVLYHTYTVDVHSIFLVEQLRRLRKGKYEDELPALTELVRAVDDRAVLYLGCLLHDVGKGRGGDHSEQGTRLAEACLERLGFPPERARRVAFLVRQHLRMSHLAQRRDLSDPRLILEFAKDCGDRANLRNLVLLTFADIRASSTDAWSEWKRTLLLELYQRTAEILEAGAGGAAQALEQIEADVRTRRAAARRALVADGCDASDVDGYFETLPQRYFIAHTPSQIARHARLALEFNPREVVASAVTRGTGGASELLLVTRDRSGLYATSAGVLTSKGLNILGANAYTTREGLALEVFRIDRPRGGPAERQAVYEDVRETLRSVLAREQDVGELLRRRRRPVLARRSPLRRPAKVDITNEESDFYTIVDVSADDRLGLLYDLTRAIAAQGLEVYISKAATILDQVADTFYLKDARGRKLTDPAAIEQLRGELLAAAAGDGDEGGAGG